MRHFGSEEGFDRVFRMDLVEVALGEWSSVNCKLLKSSKLLPRCIVVLLIKHHAVPYSCRRPAPTLQHNIAFATARLDDCFDCDQGGGEVGSGSLNSSFRLVVK